MTILLKYFYSNDVVSCDLTDNTFEGGFINEL
jgi:hypothetical protein